MSLPHPGRARRLTSLEQKETADLFSFADSPCRSQEREPLIDLGDWIA
jgi:hypothetical protein